MRRVGLLLLSITSMLLVLVLGEMAVRAADPDLALPADPRRFRFDQQNQLADVDHVRDPELGWRLRPNQGGGREDDPEGAGIRTNVHGFRGDAFDFAKDPGEVRLVFLGDSNAMGFGIPDGDAIYSALTAGLLRQRLDPAGIEVETINLGVDGYSSDQVRRLADLYLERLDPDVVFVQVGFNDHCLASRPDREMGFGKARVLGVLERSQLYRWLRRQLVVATGAHRRDYDPVPRVEVDDYEENLRHVADLAAGLGADVVLLTTPSRPKIPLTVNEVPIVEDGETEWIAQEAWVYRRLSEAGIHPPNSPRHPRFLAVLRDAIRAQPHLAAPRFLLAQGLHAQGRRSEALAALGEALARDRERKVLESYMTRLDAIAAGRPAVRVLRVSGAIAQHLRSHGKPPDTDLFLDFVHLNREGQAAVAAAAAGLTWDLLRKRGVVRGHGAPGG